MKKLILDDGLKQLNRCLLGWVTNEVFVINIRKKIKEQRLQGEVGRCYNRRGDRAGQKRVKISTDAGIHF